MGSTQITTENKCNFFAGPLMTIIYKYDFELSVCYYYALYHGVNNDKSLHIDNHTSSIIVLIIIQNIKGWAYLDTGSNVSSLKPAFATRLDLVP